MKQVEINFFRINLAGLGAVGFSIVIYYLFDAKLATTSAVAGFCVLPIISYLSYLKNNMPIFAMKPLGKISFPKRLLGLMVVTGFACACAAAISGYFFGSTGVGREALVGGLSGASTSAVFCAVFELWKQIFPIQWSCFLNWMFRRKEPK